MWQVTGGSVTGNGHSQNQDASGWVEFEGTTFAVVCDGCGEKSGSMIGARLGAELLLQCFLEVVPTQGHRKSHARLVEQIEARFKCRFMELIGAICSSARSRDEVIEEYGLFTIVLAISDSKEVAIAALGDGAYGFNGGKLRVLGPFPENRPPYFGAGLYSTPAHSQPLKIIDSREAKAVTSVLIATDGILRVGPKPKNGEALWCDVSRFMTDGVFFENPRQLEGELLKLSSTRARLVSQQRNGSLEVSALLDTGLLDDDTTVVVIRRKPEILKLPAVKRPGVGFFSLMKGGTHVGDDLLD